MQPFIPVLDTCEARGHKFFKVEGQSQRCPFCMESGLMHARREVEYLRHYGNKDCTHMADQAMADNTLENLPVVAQYPGDPLDLAKAPFQLPVRMDGRCLVDASCELIAELDAASEEEKQAIQNLINANYAPNSGVRSFQGVGVGEVWQHNRKQTKYKVYDLTNTDSGKEDFQPTVSYTDGVKCYSRRIDVFLQKFTKIEDAH